MNIPHRYLVTCLVCLPLLALSGCNLQSAESEAGEHIDRSETYTEQGQYRAAMLEVRNAIQKDPGNVSHVVRLAELYLDVGAAEQASELLVRWQQDHPESVALPLAEAYVLQNKHLSARETLEGFEPDSQAGQIRKRWLMAEADRIAGNTEGARSGYQETLRLDPAHRAATAGLAKMQIESFAFSAAIDHLKGWRQQHGADAQILFLEGLAHYQLNELELAATRLTEALAAIPSSDIFLPIRRQTLGLLARTRTEQGDITQAQIYNQILAENTDTELRESTESALEAIGAGDLDTARRTLEDLIQQNPDNDLVSLLLGAVNLQQGNVTEGESLLAENIDAETTPVPFIRLATMAQIDKGKRDQALATLERALLARPTDVDLLAMHGVLALSLPDQAKDGIVSLNKALQIDSSRVRLRLALAQYYVQAGKIEQALGQLRSAYSQNPEDWAVTNYYVSLLISQQQIAEAEQIKDQLIDRYSDEPYAAVLASMTEYRLGQTDDAINRLTAQTQATPDWNSPYLALASIHQAEQNIDAAIDALLRAAEISTNNIEPLQRAGRLYAAQHTPDAVVTWLMDVADRTPTLASSAAALAAQVRIQQGRTADARQILTPHLDSNNAAVTRVHSQLLVTEAEQSARNQQWDLARSKAAEAISLVPEELNYQLLLFRITVAEGSHNQAANLLDDIEAEFGTSAPTVLSRTLLIRQTQSAGNAYQFLKQQWEADPQPLLAGTLIGLAREVEPENALPVARQWTELQTDNPQAWLILADLHLSREEEPEAAHAYREALQRQPDNVSALNNLAWLLRTSAVEEALEYAREATRLAPENAAVIDTYGWILHMAGRHEEAVELLRKANQLAPDNQEIAEHLRTAQAAL